MRRLRLFLPVVFAVPAFFLSCESNETTFVDAPDGEPFDRNAPPGDAGTDSTPPTNDAGCPYAPPANSNGETCTGFGVSMECAQAGCGRYGFLCVNGGPPGIAGCTEKSASAFGNSYCCPTNPCVAQPDQNGACGDAGAGKTKRFQCPPLEGGGHSTPPSGCVEHVSGGTQLEKFYCCP